ncbi:MAG: response regulator [Bacteroidia bacterium]|nr:response regulator [Bacteroidia bacterium]NND24775.1 response regulator [Flavobacteriaceae bacterium]NNL33276.1 response regulator [Flavobacteriaceae bacterium]NNM35652.1 response regulator [Nitrosopumilus sp.]
MKILAIDDQQLVLLPIQKRLNELGYQVFIETDPVKGLEMFKTIHPDLVIIDINMPNVSGLDLVKSIRERDSNTPILILSGNTQDQIILQAFELGVNDFMKKPMSLNEICARVQNLIGGSLNDKVPYKGDHIMIQQRCVGVVIPCFNEEDRLLSEEFLKFIKTNSGYHLCFVNDGSTDNTLEVLHTIQNGREEYISVFDCEKNGGKAEAVRQGMLFLRKNEQLDYIGFLDADLSTDFADFDDLVKSIESSNFQIVSGSRISRMGANITKESSRKIISFTINYMIKLILSMNFKDTQCGAKIFRRDCLDVAFNKKFITRWLFDVEIFMRMKLHYGSEQAKALICELPLKRWIHADGSKLSMKDSLKIGIQLVQIAWHYRKEKSNRNIKTEQLNDLVNPSFLN